jgi:hypothetical protein
MSTSNRRKGDVQLKLYNVRVTYLDGAQAVAIAEGNNAAWSCACGSPLIGRCYFQFGHDCHTSCACGATYRVHGDEKKRTVAVVQVASTLTRPAA